MSDGSRFLWLILVVIVAIGTANRSIGQVVPGFHKVGLEMSWKWGPERLRWNSNLFSPEAGNPPPGKKLPELSLTRADFLMSGLALRRPDGTWLESSGWFACFRGADGIRRAELQGVPSQIYSGLRFQIGVSPTENHRDPNLWPANHALHPLVNGLHWGWQGGYIFMALEGHVPAPAASLDGFSYHLAGDNHLMTVTLEGSLDLRRGGTLELELDVRKILGGVDPAIFGKSTHSRPGDVRAATLRQRVEQSFSLAGVSPEVWQEERTAAGTAVPQPHEKPWGTPFPLQISARLPKVRLPADNRLTLEGVALGLRLFHDARLSINNTQSCASCHQREAAFSDAGKPVSFGAEGLAGQRNAMPLFNLAWQTEFFWDGRAKRLRDQVLEPIRDEAEMHLPLDQAVQKLSGDPDMADQFAKAFGSPDVSPMRIGLALEQFLLTLISQDSKFDKAVRGEAKLTPAEQRGLELFVTEHDPARNLRGADCFHCHGGNLFSNNSYADNGIDAVPTAGRGAVTGNAADTGKFRVPSLRNIAATAPYMHDGRFATLEQVIDHYDHGVHRTGTLDPNLAKHPTAGLGLSAPDKAALAAFLRALTDESFLKPAPSGSSLTASKP